MARVVYVLRHAQAAPSVSAGGDQARPLTDHGAEQAARVADALAGLLGSVRVDRVLCSPSVRTRQTLEPILAAGLVSGEVSYEEAVYDAGSDTLVELIGLLADGLETALLVGHAPGVPSLCWEIADRDGSDVASLEALERGYPAGTLARIELTGPWSEVGESTGRLTDLIVTR